MEVTTQGREGSLFEVEGASKGQKSRTQSGGPARTLGGRGKRPKGLVSGPSRRDLRWVGERTVGGDEPVYKGEKESEEKRKGSSVS